VVISLLAAGWLVNQAGLEIDVITRLATVTVVFTLFIYTLVILSAMKLRGHDEDEDTFIASTPLLIVGLLGNAVLLIYVLYDDPGALIWCGALLALGLLLFVIEQVFGSRKQSSGRDGGDPTNARKA